MILIALGANLASSAGKPADTIRAALHTFEQRGIGVETVSNFYASPAWPDPNDPAFVNAVARVRTALQPKELMKTLHEIESAFGRKRGARNAPRTLDLDLIDYNGVVLQDEIVLPHPRTAERAFVLVPLRDVAPLWRHPAGGKSVSDLIAALPASGLEKLPD
jgi:2-amino-4-hydroxy-6-hydroxymethyldihydropteridine diphosphokinase